MTYKLAVAFVTLYTLFVFYFSWSLLVSFQRVYQLMWLLLLIVFYSGENTR
jgi:hypothetical protein